MFCLRFLEKGSFEVELNLQTVIAAVHCHCYADFQPNLCRIYSSFLVMKFEEIKNVFVKIFRKCKMVLFTRVSLVFTNDLLCNISLFRILIL